MKIFFEDTKLLIAEIIGLVGGFLWAKNTDWDYEPVILLTISFVGLVIFIILKIFYSDENRPVVELELIWTTSHRNPPLMIPDKSPKNEEGFYFHKNDGIYFYEITHKYDLILRNNSIQNAYNVSIYVPKVHFLKYKNETNILEPLIIDRPKIINIKYNIGKGMTYGEADKLLGNKLTDELKSTEFIVEYQNESRKTYYSKFTPLSSNIKLKKKPININTYRKL